MARPARAETAEVREPALIRSGRRVAAVIHVVCPLLFFTNLTRNPYFTQIALLNIGIAICGLLWVAETFRRGEWRLPAFPFGLPVLAFLGAALLSSVLSFAVHSYVRSGLAFEMIRVWIFTLVNCAMALYLPGIYTTPVGEEPAKKSIWVDITLAFLWGAMWLGFHEMRNPEPTEIIWDTYGAFLWGLAIAYALARTRRGDALSFFHVVFAVSVVAGTYGVLQYWGRDIIWSSPVQPYGGRPVSTFGNPNFVSSYLMMTSALAVALSLQSPGRNRWGYALVALVSGVGVLSTLTRSTYVGLLVALGVMTVALHRKGELRLLRPALAALAVFVGLVLLFPSTPVTRIQSPLARFTEILQAMESGTSYGPWHQRLLIWSAAWEMLTGAFFLLGRGWGSFELFYPFFQGKFLLVPGLAQWRTHANNAHNILLEVWSQTGIVGTGLALWAMVAMLVGGWYAVRRASGASRAVMAALLGAIAGMIADNFFGNVSIFFAVPAFLFWWIVGALFHEERPQRVWTAPVGDALGRPLLIVLAAACVASSTYYVLRWKQEVHYFMGFKQAKGGDIAGSVKSLEAAYNWFPGDVNSNYEWGNSLSRWARSLSERGLSDEANRASERAMKAYRAALAANPGYDEIYFNEAVTLSQLGQKEEATDRLEISLFINPVLKEAYNSLGTIYLSLGKNDRAAETYELGTRAFPKDKDFWNNLGYAYTQLRRHDDAFKAYKQAVTLDPDFSQGWANLAAAARETRQKDPILEVPDLVRSMERNLRDKNFEAALKNSARIAEILPNSPDAHLSLGNLHFFLNNIDRAEAELKIAIKLDPNFAPAYGNLGRMYALRRKFDLAREYLGRALELNPSDQESRRALDDLPK